MFLRTTFRKEGTVYRTWCSWIGSVVCLGWKAWNFLHTMRRVGGWALVVTATAVWRSFFVTICCRVVQRCVPHSPSPLFSPAFTVHFAWEKVYCTGLLEGTQGFQLAPVQYVCIFLGVSSWCDVAASHVSYPPLSLSSQMPCLSGSNTQLLKKTHKGKWSSWRQQPWGTDSLCVSCGCVGVRRGTNRKVCLGIVWMCGPTSRVWQLLFRGEWSVALAWESWCMLPDCGGLLFEREREFFQLFWAKQVECFLLNRVSRVRLLWTCVDKHFFLLLLFFSLLHDFNFHCSGYKPISVFVRCI